MEDNKIKVYITGTEPIAEDCNDSWRNYLKQHLKFEVFDSLNKSNEERKKVLHECDWIVSVIAPEINQLKAVSEAIKLSERFTNSFIFCIAEKEHYYYNDNISGLKYVENIIQSEKSFVFNNIDEIIGFINNSK